MRVVLTLSMGLILTAPAALAQQTGNVVGTVYDSLAGIPLVGARVWVQGTSASALTDNRGRFTLRDLMAGSVVVSFANDALDSIGFPGMARRVSVVSDSTVVADFFVPSLARLHRVLCGHPPPGDSTSSGIVFGDVADPRSGARLAGVRLRVAWTSVEWQRGRPLVVRPLAVEAHTDSLGNYYLCDVPLHEALALTAAARNAETGIIELQLGRRGVLRQDLLLEVDSGAQKGGIIVGQVSDTTGRPLRGARSSVDGNDSGATTDDAGRFVLRSLPLGSRMLTVGAIGYGFVRQVVQLREGDTVNVRARLQPITMLDTIQVAGRSNLVLQELLARLRAGGSYSLTGDNLRHAGFVSSVLQSLPGITVTGNALRGCAQNEAPGGNCMVLLTSVTHVQGSSASGQSGTDACRVHIWIDGTQADEEVLAGIHPSQLLAVEWFPRGSFLPVKYTPTDNCGTLLVWTDSIR